ncbi:MAG: class A beta-lactamase-related serine hydrolase [Acidobacteria bacterium]|nr:MAG: class A beta-lactamase-related serine hydrolase [Acidobacteriota bacterium]REJ98040.1 MAG: class A beta-lactamase-related serine hydrolase [Acidobacteriota bacterium]REK16783.1 MAG: class A beta-lactamase-related serine hydrolase [Acidobacteriota bacterium]REK42694.1 MAG: class A beta-lactamase-related serine hydrolase [Acidobacteriota bacterium]
MSTSPRSFFIALVVLFCLAATAFGQATQEQEAAVDKLFAEWNKTDSPGAAVGVITNGEFILKKGYGSADLEHDVPITPKSVFYMASVSKQFVTMAILLLEEQGKLGLDDEIQKYFPDFPKYDGPLTIRNFIHHTSGVRDNLTLWQLSGRDIYDSIEVDEMYQMIRRQKELNFTPGDRYLYSNSCYFMLAQIVEKVSGKPIKEFAEEEMFKPLGMKNTHFHDDQYHIVKNRVFSYSPGKDGYRNLIMRFDLVGSGGLYSNVEDLLMWDRNFYDNKLGKKQEALVEKMEEEGLLNDGSSTGYAFGLSNGTHKGLRTVGHSGGLAGYSTYMVRYPDQNFSVIVLANLAGFNSVGKSREIAEIFLKDEFKEKAPAGNASNSTDQKEPETYATLTAEQLKSFEGTFWNPENSIFSKILTKEGKMMIERDGIPPTEVKPLSENSLKVLFPGLNVVLTFQNGDGGKHGYGEVINGRPSLRFDAYETPDYSEAQLSALVGSYFSEEVNAYYKFTLNDGKLSLSINDKDLGALEPLVKDLWRNETVGVITIDSDSNGSPTGFRLDAGRVRNLKFVRR